jgi:hypothetical protein
MNDPVLNRLGCRSAGKRAKHSWKSGSVLIVQGLTNKQIAFELKIVEDAAARSRSPFWRTSLFSDW